MMTGTETMNQHTILATRLGDLTVVRNAEAVVGLYFPHHWYMPGPDTFGPRTDEGFDEVAWQLKEYLAGGRREFDLPLQARGSGPQRRVWDLVAKVPYGQTTTYRDLARRLNRDVTPQQIGADISRNPLCILIPCHRVVGTNGKLTGYAGGLERKRALLELEQLAPGPVPHEALVTVGG
jgi:methylated-DNA-[protein]-cysteine S-methyltransferase